MSSPCSHRAYPRLCFAHWPVPLTASGAAVARPSCLPSQANQLISLDDLRQPRPMKKAWSFASGPSSICRFIPPQEARFERHAAIISEEGLIPSESDLGNALRNPSNPSLFNPVRKSDVTQDSDFSTKSRIGKNSVFPPCPPGVWRPPERLTKIQPVSSETSNP